MMKQICSILILLFLISCQENKEKVIVQDMPETLPTLVNEVTTDTILYPLAIYPYDKWLLAINLSDYSDNVFDFINASTLQKEFAIGKFGNGANELYDCNPYFFSVVNKDTVEINANVFNITKLFLTPQKLRIVDAKNISFTAVNNLLKLSPTLYAFKPLIASEKYDVYDTEKREIVAHFGSFPDVKLTGVDEKTDVANFFQEHTVFHPESGRLFSFYRNLPLIRIYEDFQLKKEIWTADDYNTNVTDFYEDKNKVFYASACVRNHLIYAIYINKDEAGFLKEPTKTLLVWNAEGTLVKRYLLKKPFQVYTISADGTKFYGIDNTNADKTTVFTLDLN